MSNIETIIMLDSLAERYGLLPSEIMAKGDTLDIVVLVRSSEYYRERAARQEKGMSMPTVTQYTQDQLQAMIDQVKS